MKCPNCAKHLRHIEKDNQSILHCPNCGGSFFQQNGINRISVTTARELSDDHKSKVIMGSEHHCPIDSAILRPVQNDEAIPQDVTLLQCPTCFGIFAYPEDLLKFKRAQHVKIEFFKIWGKPMPSIQTVLVLGLAGLMALTFVLNTVSLKNKNLTTTSAEDVIKNITVQKTDSLFILYYQTKIPARSYVIFTNKTRHTSVTRQISTTSDTVHLLSVNDMDMNDEIYYQVVLIDEKGQEIKTAMKKL